MPVPVGLLGVGGSWSGHQRENIAAKRYVQEIVSGLAPLSCSC